MNTFVCPINDKYPKWPLGETRIPTPELMLKISSSGDSVAGKKLHNVEWRGFFFFSDSLKTSYGRLSVASLRGLTDQCECSLVVSCQTVNGMGNLMTAIFQNLPSFSLSYS